MATKAISKPQMRNLLEREIKKNLAVGITLACISGIAYKFLVCEPRKQKYAEFYKNYDAEKEFQRMKAKGIFTSCK